jgi:8-oxo-dGTP pyrophosphatase MutT (NUDIX family)
MTFTLDTIATLLENQPVEHFPGNGRTNASVAMILREGASELELLLIQRSIDERDPWSGNLAFPGGRAMPGEEPRSAAERETAEEIGLDLKEARYLGRLPDVIGSHLPVQVSCHIYGINGAIRELVLNHEVHAGFWIGLDDLAEPQRHVTATVTFGGEAYEVPAIYIPRPDTPVLWGLTYRLVMQFMELLRTA